MQPNTNILNIASTSKSLISLFESSVELCPNKTAIFHRDQSITYKELNCQANAIAAYLKQLEVNENSIVTILIERSINLIAAMLGIMKAGCAYSVIDPDYPISRIEYILNDTNSELLLTDTTIQNEEKYKNLLISQTSQQIYISDLLIHTNDYIKNPPLQSTGETLACVIYTSGSTGKPKGVLLPHKSFFRLFNGPNMVQTTSDDCVAQIANASFDGAIYEIWSALGKGGSLVIIDKSITLSAPALEECFLKHNVSMAALPTGLFNQLVKTTPSIFKVLKRIIFVGEAANPEIVRTLINSSEFRPQKLFNGYGPTECGIGSTYYEIKTLEDKATSVPIGSPINDTQIYILDENLDRVLPGEIGEIYIAGDGLARGYLNLPDLTAEKFMLCPFDVDSKMYRTGDLGRLLPDGMLDFVGRKDNQVKVRGFRIELEEIECALESHPSIWKAVVLAPYTHQGHRQLIAYLMPKNQENKIEIESIKSHLKRLLPDYMIPGIITQLGSLPLTPHGKVDRQKLSEVSLVEEIKTIEETADLSEIEKALLKIWKKVLGIENIQLNDNFFDLGGDSIMIMQMIAQAAENGIALSYSLILQQPTIQSLASLARNKEESVQEEELIDHTPFDLSAIQTLFFDESFKNPNYFHHLFHSSLKETINIDCAKKAISYFTEYHDAFRLRFFKEDGKYRQCYSKEAQPCIVAEMDLKGLSLEEADKTINDHKDQLCRSIDIHNGPLIKAVIFTNEQKPISLMIVIHHLIIDGISWRILINDLSRLYKQLLNQDLCNLPPKGASFKTWVSKAKEYAVSKNLLQEMPHWVNTINDFSLPVDHQKGPNIESSNRILRKTLSPKMTHDVLKTIPHTLHVDINDILLTALFQTICKWTGQSKIIFDLEGHGREDIASINLARTVGWFTGVFPVLLKDQSNSLKASLFEIQAQLKKIPIKGVGYGILKFLNEDPNIRKCLNHTIDVPIRFNYLGQFDQNSDDDPLFEFDEEPLSSPIDPENKRTHLLLVESWVSRGQFQITWHYSDNYHRAETIEKLALTFNETLESLIEEVQECTVNTSLAHYNLKELSELLPDIEDVQAVYSLTPIQEGLLFHAIQDPKSEAYFVQTYWHCRGEYNAKAMLEAWNAVFRNHELFRASYLWEGLAYPVQVIYKEAKVTITEEDWSMLSSEEQETRLHEFLAKDRGFGIDLRKPPLMRLTIILLPNTERLMVWSFHHIILDILGGCRMMEELDHYYSMLCSGRKLSLKQVSSFGDYIKWQKRQNHSNNKLFWERYLDDFTSLNQICFKKQSDLKQLHRKTSYFQFNHNLSEQLSQSLHEYARNNRLTLNVVMQGMWTYLLSIYCNTLDIVFGLTVSTRPPEIRNVNSIVGPLINTLPFRMIIDPDAFLLDYFKSIQNNLGEIIDHSSYSHIEIQRGSQVASGNALFDSLFGFESQQVKELEKNLSNFYNIRSNEITHYPLSLYIIPGDRIQFKVSYDENLYSKDNIDGLINHYINLLINLTQKDHALLRELSCLSDEEFKQMTIDWNQTKKEYPQEKTIHQMFEEQTERTPNNIAVIYEDITLTYRQLNEKANQLAHFIRSLTDMRPDTLIALCLDRSEKMIISILAILKAGAAYVPMDPNYPDDRIKYMLEDTKTKLLITNEIYKERLENLDQKIYVFAVDDSSSENEVEKQLSGNIINNTGSENLAHVIYTSGTTGQPKGVMSKHTGVVNRIKWFNDSHVLQESDRILQKTPYVFDVSVWELFWANWFGACTVFAKPEIHKDANAIINLIKERNITIVHFVPSVLNVFEEILEENFKQEEPKDNLLSSLRKIFCSGEALSLTQVQKVHQLLPNVEIHNLYGPTEASIDVLYYNCSNKTIAAVYLGKPIDNTTAYILNDRLTPLPIGTEGELYIGGVGLARGYLNKPALTEEKFIKNPFQTKEEKQLGYNEILYKTGDLVRWSPDGQIEYLGRNDFQVKINGFRIELGDIETVLCSFEEIKQSVVIAKEKEGKKYLIGYYLADKKLEEKAVLYHLKKKLPEYMVPSILVYLQEIPLNINGKLDRKALPLPEFVNDQNYVEPNSELEKKLCSIWKEVLNLERLGITDDFFRIGGDSLNAVRLISRIRKELGVKINLRSVFDAPTIEQLSELLRDSSGIRSIVNKNTTPSGPSFIIPLQTKGNKRPLFLIHPIGGTVFCYLPFRNYITDRPVYGIEDPGINSNSKNFDSLEELAVYYLKGIKQIQPEGPYLLGGSSLGGIISIEIANQLNACAESTEFIGLFDSWAQFPDAMNQKDWFEKHMQEKHAEMNHQLVQAGLDSKDPWFNLQWKRKKLSLSYQIPVISNKVTLFKAEGLADALDSFNSPTNLMDPYCKCLEVRLVPGDHYSMFNEHNVEKLAKILKTSLN